MAKDQIISQIKQTWENFNNLQIEDAIDSAQNISPWNNLTLSDFMDSVEDLKSILAASFDQNIWEDYPWNIVNSVQSALNNVLQQSQQFVNSKNQGSFQNALQQVENLRTNFRSWNVYSYILYGQDIETKIGLIDTEYQSIISKGREIDILKESVQNLIEPAVAGSLSKSFSDRQTKLESNRKVWLITAITAAVLSAVATIVVIWILIDVLSLEIPNEASTKQIQELIDKQPSNVGIQLLRVAILIPFYSLFIYSFNQYKRERNLEEEYAHRSAVSTSLPNYGELAGDPNVKDQIISSATNVIFTSPIEKKVSNKRASQSNLNEVKDIIDSLGKVIKSDVE